MKKQNKFIHIIKSCILCIKYPFLYIRSPYNDFHYNSWKLYKKIYGYIYADNNRSLYANQNKSFYHKFIFMIYDFYYKYILQFFHCIPTGSWYDSIRCYKGWDIAFGKQFLKDLDLVLRKENLRNDFRIHGIKEKFSRLDISCSNYTEPLLELFNKYEELSYNTCIECGKPSKIITAGYMLPYCEGCYENVLDKSFRHIQYIKKDNEWVKLDS